MNLKEAYDNVNEIRSGTHPSFLIPHVISKFNLKPSRVEIEKLYREKMKKYIDRKDWNTSQVEKTLRDILNKYGN